MKQSSDSETISRRSLQQCTRMLITISRMRKIWIAHRIDVIDNIRTPTGRKFSGQIKYAIEYMRNHPTKMVYQGDVLHYCDQRQFDETHGEKMNYKDNSRQIEKLRKDTLPNRWRECTTSQGLCFIYIPELRELVCEDLITHAKHKKDTFSRKISQQALERADDKCELTGLPVEVGSLAADHWISKESGGTSDYSNCVILNKILNEKKNKHDPVEWFCKNLLTNFLKLCERSGMDMQMVGKKLLTFLVKQLGPLDTKDC